MKKIITVLMLLLYSLTYGQSNLTNAEYFIDHDPGYGNANDIPLLGDTVIISESILNDLAAGLHTIYLRVKDDSDTWGMAEAISFKVLAPIVIPEISPIDYVEYFFEEDPGFGLASEITISSNDTVLISELIPTDGLNKGINIVSVRAKNENGVWGIPESIAFYIREDHIIADEKIDGLEYFIDEDPGIGNGIFVSLPAADTVLINEWLESQELSDGVHKLGVRIQSDSGTWGLREWREFEYLNCEVTMVDIESVDEFCIGDSVHINGPIDYDAWFWNTYSYESNIYINEPGIYYVSVYDSTSHQCFFSDTLSIAMFSPPNASFTFSSTFNNIETLASGEGQNLFWLLNDEFNSTEESFSYSFLTDGWQSICLEASNVCGLDEVCDTVLLCAEFETPPYFYLDSDEDGYGVPSDSIRACTAPIGFADNVLDCDDSNNAINPGETEILYNGIDDDCNPETLDTQDLDGDGFNSDVDCNDNDDSVYPGAPEIPDDGIDQDCDGVDLVTGIHEVAFIISSISPNPAKDFVKISFNKSTSGEIQFFNASGKQAFSRQINNVEEINLDLRNLAPGLYLIQFKNKDLYITKRIIIQ